MKQESRSTKQTLLGADYLLKAVLSVSLLINNLYSCARTRTDLERGEGDRERAKRKKEGGLGPFIAVFDHEQEAVLLSSIHYPGSRLSVYVLVLVLVRAEAEAEADSEQIAPVICSRASLPQNRHIFHLMMYAFS